MARVLKYFSPHALPFHLEERWTRGGGAGGAPRERPAALARLSFSSRAVYVGNLAFVTTDAQVHALFSRAGPLERVVMGVNKVTREPAGFAFAVFRARAGALAAVAGLNGTVLDERRIKVEMDKGFHEGKQYGRGAVTGGQVRDEMRADYDEGRGGAGLGLAAAAAAGGSGGGRGRSPRGGRSPHAGGGARRAGGGGLGGGPGGLAAASWGGPGGLAAASWGGPGGLAGARAGAKRARDEGGDGAHYGEGASGGDGGGGGGRGGGGGGRGGSEGGGGGGGDEAGDADADDFRRTRRRVDEDDARADGDAPVRE